MNDKHMPEVFAGKDPDFPWGAREPAGGFKVGDYVGLAYSDHDEYVFDNPEGVITAIDDDQETVTVVVPASIIMSRVHLIARPKPGQTIHPDGKITLTEEQAS